MEIPLHWRLKQQRYALVGSVCTHCGASNLSRRPVCLQCGSVTGRTLVIGQQHTAVELPIKVSETSPIPARGG